MAARGHFGGLQPVRVASELRSVLGSTVLNVSLRTSEFLALFVARLGSQETSVLLVSRETSVLFVSRETSELMGVRLSQAARH